MRMKDIYTSMMCEDYIERTEKVSKCEHCGSKVMNVYEKDNTPGFKCKDEWIEYSCDCRHYVGKTSKEVFEILTREHEKEVEKYKKECEELRKNSFRIKENMSMGNDLLKCYMFEDILLCDNCGEEHDKSDFAVCNECGDYMCKSCIENSGGIVDDYVCEACVDNDEY